MKILIVYYSRTGNTKKVAKALRDYLQCDIEEIKSVKNYDGPLGWVKAGKEGSQRVNGKIEAPVKNPADYDLVVIGTPIWAWHISSPARGYLAMSRDKIKKIAAFCTMGSDYGRSFEEIEAVCGKSLEAKMVLSEKEVSSGDISEKIKNFIKK